MTLLADPAERASAAGPAAGTEVDRAEQARAVLRRAEERTGVLRHRTATVPSPPALAPAVAPVEHRTRTRHVEPPDERVWPVHDALAPLLPLGGLQRGTVLAVRGSTSLLLALVARPSRSGAWTAAVGFPAVGLLAAADAGADLDRVVLVPRPGPDAALVVSALVDGLDVVVVGPDAALTDTDRRRLAARARERGALLVAAAAWPGAHVALTVTGGGWSGADRGAGWLRRRTLVVERAGRGGAARPARVEVELPLGHDDWPAFVAEDARAATPGTAATGAVPRPARVDDPGRPSRLRLVG